MSHSPLTREQFRQLHLYLASPQRRLHRLAKLVDRRPFISVDPQYRDAVYAALDAVQTLSILTYYRSCESGVASANAPEPPRAEASQTTRTP